MLHSVTSPTDPYTALIKDDPVRPEIPLSFRVSDHTQMFVLTSDDEWAKPQAAVCVAYTAAVPKTVQELYLCTGADSSHAVFYTIWSYAPGAGRLLIQESAQWIRKNKPEISVLVTLSPPTEMARTFHLRNGAGILSVNSDTVNYLYNI